MVAAHEFECFAMLLPMCRMVAEQPAEKAIKEVVAKIQKQADDEKTEAFSSAKAAALAYHKNISMAHLAYHYKLNNTLVEARLIGDEYLVEVEAEAVVTTRSGAGQ